MKQDLHCLGDLGRLLDRTLYRLLIHNLTNGRIHQAPWVRAPTQRARQLAHPAATLLQLLHLGQAVDLEQGRQALGPELLDELAAVGLLQAGAGELSAGPFVVLPFEGLYLVTHRWEPGQPTEADHLWFGTDTCYVARTAAPGRGARVLELCSGVGTHALVMASRGAQVVGVDINPEAVRVARWNAWLNGLEQRARFCEGDLYEPVSAEQFDYVLSSPPFLPYPEEGHNELLFATAGPSGLVIMERILDGLGARLVPGGRALFLAAGFGDSHGPQWVEALRRRAVEQRWQVELILLDWGEARQEMARLGQELPTVAAELDRLAAGLDPSCERYWSFTVAVQRPAAPGGELLVTDTSTSWGDALRAARGQAAR